MWAKTHTFAASLKLKWKVLSLRPLLKDINDIHFQSHFVHLQFYMRRAYQTISQSYTRRASFAGTVNKKQFLTDLTGNRRFLCFEVENINLNHQVPMNQLYAQLLHLFKTGFQFWFDESEIAMLNEKNAQFRYISVEEEALAAHFEPCHAGEETSFLQTTQILQALVLKTGFKSLSIQVLGRVLRDMKFERVKRNGVYGYLVKEKKHRI